MSSAGTEGPGPETTRPSLRQREGVIRLVLSPAASYIVREVDAHLDANTSEPYLEQPLAGHWARVTKVCEEAGEVWRALSNLTGENPRKGVCGTEDELLEELADTAMAAICGIQHMTKDTERTQAVLAAAVNKSAERVRRHAASGDSR